MAAAAPAADASRWAASESYHRWGPPGTCWSTRWGSSPNTAPNTAPGTAPGTTSQRAAAVAVAAAAAASAAAAAAAASSGPCRPGDATLGFGFGLGCRPGDARRGEAYGNEAGGDEAATVAGTGDSHTAGGGCREGW